MSDREFAARKTDRVSERTMVASAIVLTTMPDPPRTSLTVHCWVTIRREHEEAFQALLNTVTAGSQFRCTPVGELHLHGLPDAQRVQLLQDHEDLIYPDKHGAVFVLEELWCEVKGAVAQIAPSAIKRHRIAIGLSFADKDTLDKLRIELSIHPSLNYVEVEFGED